MFAKTFRSAVSLMLVCCLLLGLSGNAVVLAVENPVSGKLDEVDAKVNSTIADLEATIADLEAEVDKQEQTLEDAKAQLESGKQDLADAQATLDEKKELLEDAKAELDKLQGKLDEADEMLGKLEEKAAEYQAELDDAQVKLDDAQAKLDEAQAKLDEANALLAEKEEELAEAEALLAEKEAERNQASADFDKAMEEFLELEAEVKAMPDGPAKEAAQKELDELGAKVNEANKELGAAAEKLKDARAQLDSAKEQLSEAKAQLADAQKQLDDAQAQKDDAQAQKNEYQAKLDDAKVQLKDAQEQVAWAKGEYQKLYDTIDEINATIDNYQAKIDEINEAVEEAEEALPVAEKALVEANEALADAKTVVENIKATYATLHNAVYDPSVSASFVKDTVTTLNEQVQQLWDSVLALQTSLHELIAAYEELEGFAIDPIYIEDYYFAGLVIEPFEVGEYHYDEAGFHFYGYKFDGYTVDPVTVEGYSFEGFTAPAMPEQLTTISEKLDAVIAKATTVNATLHYYVLAAKDLLVDVLEKAGVAADIAIDFARNHLNKEGAVKVYNWLYNNPDKVCHYIKQFGVHCLDLIVTYGPYAVELLENHSDLVVLGMKLTAGATYVTATLGAKLLGYLGDKMDFLADYKDDVAAACAKLYNKYGDEAKALIKVYVEYLQLEERYFDATHGVYVIGGPNLYVALGDDSAESVSYADMLAEQLGVDFENLADHDLTIQEAVAANLETLKKADLITIGYSANTAAKNAYNALNAYLAQEGYEEADWSTLVSDKYDGMIELALDKIEAQLIANGFDKEFIDGISLVELAMVAMEAYLCDYLNYIVDSRNAINDIQAVNDDALIVLVGMYNPYEGVILTHGEKSVDLGALYDLLVEAVDCYYLAYAFVNENTIFVNAPAVETSVVQGETDLYEFLGSIALLPDDMADEMDATEAGHAYIKDQIWNALEVKTLGDVNHDGKVNNVDAMMVMQYYVKLIDETGLDLDVADVTFNDKINNCDAMKIMQYYVKLINDWNEVPVCK